jgi:hypothetical protein
MLAADPASVETHNRMSLLLASGKFSDMTFVVEEPSAGGSGGAMSERRFPAHRALLYAAAPDSKVLEHLLNASAAFASASTSAPAASADVKTPAPSASTSSAAASASGTSSTSVSSAASDTKTSAGFASVPASSAIELSVKPASGKNVIEVHVKGGVPCLGAALEVVLQWAYGLELKLNELLDVSRSGGATIKAVWHLARACKLLIPDALFDESQCVCMCAALCDAQWR